MENLLRPDVGLMFWTVVTFLVMVVILKKIAWGPLLGAIEEREEKIRVELEAAAKNRQEMEALKNNYAQQWAELEAKAKEFLSDAQQKGNLAKESLLKEAEEQARKLTDKTRQQLEIEKERLVKELQTEVTSLSLLIAEKLMQKSVDKQVQDNMVQEFIAGLDKQPQKMH